MSDYSREYATEMRDTLEAEYATDMRDALEAGRKSLLDAEHVLMDLLDRIGRRIAEAVALEREACARVAEGGRFLHDDAPDARFGKACADAIRARGKR